MTKDIREKLERTASLMNIALFWGYVENGYSAAPYSS